jgi:hypothetical protein
MYWFSANLSWKGQLVDWFIDDLPEWTDKQRFWLAHLVETFCSVTDFVCARKWTLIVGFVVSKYSLTSGMWMECRIRLSVSKMVLLLRKKKLRSYDITAATWQWCRKWWTYCQWSCKEVEEDIWPEHVRNTDLAYDFGITHDVDHLHLCGQRNDGVKSVL